MNKFIYITFILLYPVLIYGQSIENINFQQTEEDQVIVTYDIVGSSNQTFDVELWLSLDGGTSFPTQPKTVSGDVGKDVSAGQGKRIIWQVLYDIRKLEGSDFVFKVVAREKISSPVISRETPKKPTYSIPGTKKPYVSIGARGAFSTAKQFLDGGMFHLGYQKTSFNNQIFKDNVAKGTIDYWGGFEGGYWGTYLPLLINLDIFYHNYQVIVDSLANTQWVRHLGGNLSLSLALLPFQKFIIPYAGGGYQISSLFANNESGEIRLKTSSLFWTAGGQINLPIHKGRDKMLNRIVFGVEYKSSLAAKTRSWNQLYVFLGLGGPLWDKK